jgi:hypothetical protein
LNKAADAADAARGCCAGYAVLQEKLESQAFSEYDLFVAPDAITALSNSRRKLVRKYQNTMENP